MAHSILSRMWRPPAPEQRQLTVVADWRGGGIGTAAGINVTPDKAMQATAVYACVRVLAESVASLPLILYERDGNGKRRATDHPLYTVLHSLPNPEMTRTELWEALVGHAALRGNAYAYIEWGDDGQVRELWPLRPDRVVVHRYQGQLLYEVQMPSGTPEYLPAWQVMHIRGLSSDGLMGYSPIAMGRQAVGLLMAAEEFGARFFGNDARPGGVLEHPGILGDEAYANLLSSWEGRHGGLSNSHKVAILEEGMRYSQIGIAPNDAQFLETRNFQTAEVARLFRIPPHMIGDLSHSTNNNIEHQGLEFVTNTLRPWLVRIEQAITKSLLLPTERPRFFAEHLVDALLRGDTTSRYAAYAVGRGNGWLSANDIREKENMNPIEGGDEYWVPLNMAPLGQVPPTAEPAPTRNEPMMRSIVETAVPLRPEQRMAANSRHTLAQAQEHVLADVMTRIVRREAQDVGTAARKFSGRNDQAGFRTWLAEFYEAQQAYIVRQLMAPMRAYAELVGAAVSEETGRAVGDVEAFTTAYVNTAAVRHVARSQAGVEAVLDSNPDDWGTAVADDAAEWPETQPEGMAHEESIRAGNALAVAMYVGIGLLGKRWVSFGDSCPFCSRLNGQQSGITEIFLPAGADFEGVGGVVLKVTRNIGHPPAHRGCDCMVVGI